MVSLSFERSASMLDGSPVLSLNITSSVDLDTRVFKYKVSDLGEDKDYYVSVCNVEDLNTLGTVRTGGPTYYRKSEAVIKYNSIHDAAVGKSEILEDLQTLIDSYQKYISDFVGTDTLVLEATDV